MPSYIQIEQVYGICSARCTMCTIQDWTNPPKIMSVDEYSILLEKFLPIKNQKFLTLHGDGEVLFDKALPQKIALAKQMGYKGVGFATNCTHLDENMAAALLESGLDSIICSVDGVNKITHENIRVGTNFDAITDNIMKFIALRNASKFKTRVLVRFIRQASNFNEWDEYCALWNSRLDAGKGDSVLRFDVHNWGGARKVGKEERRKAERMYLFG